MFFTYLSLIIDELNDPGGGGADAVEVGEDQLGGGAVEGDVVGAGKSIQSEMLTHHISYRFCLQLVDIYMEFGCISIVK